MPSPFKHLIFRSSFTYYYKRKIISYHLKGKLLNNITFFFCAEPKIMFRSEFIPGDADRKTAGSQVFPVLGFRIKECDKGAPRPWSEVMRCHPDLFIGEGRVSPNTPQGIGSALSLGKCLEPWKEKQQRQWRRRDQRVWVRKERFQEVQRKGLRTSPSPSAVTPPTNSLAPLEYLPGVPT